MRQTRVLLSGVVLMLGLTASWRALALRPFDGTDASVADPGEFELELGPLQTLREGPARSRIHPAVVANWGLPGDRELVLEGRVRTIHDQGTGSRTQLEDDTLSLKQVLRRGSLQEEAGPTTARSVLFGFIWTVKTRLALDAAVRTGRSGGQHVQEIRAGLTWTVGD